MLLLLALQSHLTSLMTDLASQLHSDYIMLSITKLAELTVVVLVSSGFVQKKEQTEVNPKKFRSGETSTANVKHCIICNSDKQDNLRKVTTENVDSNLKSWAKESKNFMLTGKLTVQAADAHADDTYYHIQCYLHLRDLARSSNRQASSSSTPAPFDPIACAEIVAGVEDSDSIFKLSALRQIYRSLLEDQGKKFSDKGSYIQRDSKNTSFVFSRNGWNSQAVRKFTCPIRLKLLN